MTKLDEPTSPSFPTRLAGLLVLCALFATTGFAADEVADPANPMKPTVTPADVKQLFVPANSPKEWPLGDWEILSAKEYRRLLEGLKTRPAVPAEVTIQKGRYQAVFTGENLTGGRMDFQIQRGGGERLVSLDPLNLAVTSLWWSEADKPKPAAWGNTPGGRTLLLLPPSRLKESLTLEGEWRATGRRLSERVEFDLNFASAVVTELELYLPEAWTLQSSEGHVQGPWPLGESSRPSGIPLNEPAGFRLWRIVLGSKTACELSLSQKRPEQPAKPLLFAESDTTYLVRERELQIESRYEMEAVFAPVSQVVFQVPRSIRVYAVSYGGDVNLNWRLKSLANQQQVVIDFPDPLLGKSRPIRIQGLARVQANRAWQLPRVMCPEAALIRGELHLTVESPMELRSYELAGFRQTAISVQANQRETLTFSQMAADRGAQLTAYIGTPAFSASAQVVSYLTTGTEDWQMRTEVTWLAQSGSRYEAVCEVLPGWEILDVRRPGESSLPVISNWSRSARGRRLTIEFLEALTPQQSKRVQILARRLPLSSDQTMSLAPVQPREARSIEQFLAVHSHQGDILAPNFSVEVLSKASTFPAFVQNSPLWPLLSSQGFARDVQFFVSKGLPSDASLTLRRTAPSYDATVNVLVNLTNQEIQETLAITIEPLEAPIDRLMLLAPPFGKDWSWELLSGESPPTSIDAPDSTADANGASEANAIPWELALPVLQSTRFQILAKRRGEPLPLPEIGLPYLPQARDFQGTVEISAPGGTLLDVETSLTTQEQRLPGGREPAETEILRRWHYQSPDATLTVAHLPNNAAPRSLMGRLTLLSVINGFSHSNIHRARYELESSAEQTAFPFQLPENVRLIEVRLNDEKVSPSQSGEGFFLHYLPPSQKNFIEICYQENWPASGLSPTCTAPIPRTEIALLGFDWRFAVSPNLKLSSPPAGLALESSATSIPWSTRFFGPLGQSSREDFFRPWDWNAWRSPADSEPHQASLETEAFQQGFFPSGWTVHRAQGPRAADDLKLVFWNRDLVNPLAWVALLVSLAVGVLFRLLRISYRRPLGLAWLLLNFAGAGLLPAPWAILCGGSLAGALISVLLPRRFLKYRPPVQDPVPLGSTASFQHHPAVSTLLLLGLGLFAAGQLAGNPRVPALFAQQIPPPPESSPAVEIKQAIDFNVLVPVDDPQNPRSASDAVYINRRLLQRLRSAQPKPAREESYLISSAKYDVEIDPLGSVELTADFLVTVLTPREPVKIALPIENAFLGGLGCCRVDGVPHAVFSEPNFPGYVLELSPKPIVGPAIAEKSSGSIDAQLVTTRRIRLQLHGDAAAIPVGGGRFQFSVPPASASELTARLSEPHASIQLLGQEGKILSSASGKSLSATIGTAKKLDLVWSQKPDGLPRPIKRPPTVSALAMIHPFWIEWQIRAEDLPPAGSPSVSLVLPKNTVVRAVKSERLESFQMRSEAGRTRLLMEFPEPPAAEFSVDIQCRSPRDFSMASEPGEARLPPLDLFAGESLGAEYYLGVNSTPELAIGLPDSASPSASDFSNVSPDRFVSTYRLTPSETPAIRAPQLAWKVLKPGELRLPVESRVPSKRVRLIQEGQLTEREIKWSLAAEIETSGAKAFRHAFRVPEQFLIDSVSVIEDETERLVRWTQTGASLELVLSDGTTGIQNVNITGWLPFLPKEGSRTNLPMIQVEDAEVVDSRLRLFQSRTLNHHVRVLDIRDLVQLEEDASSAETNGSFLVAGVRLAEPAKVLSIEVGGEMQPYRLEKAIVIERENASQIRVTTLLHFLNPQESRQNLHVRLPAGLTREFRVESLAEPGVIVPYETQPHSDNSLDLVFHPASQPVDTLRIESLIETQSAERAELVSLQVIEGRVDNSFLIVSPELALEPLDNAELPEALAREDLPDWLQQTKTFREQSTGYRLFRQPGHSWKLVPAKTQHAAAAGEFTVHTTVSLTDAETVFGRTLLELPGQNMQSISWQWPQGAVLQGALLDGRDLSPVMDEENHSLLLLLPSRTEIKAPAPNRLLELYWSRKPASGIPRFGRLEFAVPKPKDVPIREAHLDLVPAPYARLVPQEGIISGGRSRNAFRSLEAGSLSGLLPAEEPDWTISLWTMDSRTERILVVGLLVLILGAAMHGGLRFNIGEWLNNHPGLSLAALGLLWWTCFAGSAFGLLLLLASPMVALSKKWKPESLPEFRSET